MNACIRIAIATCLVGISLVPATAHSATPETPQSRIVIDCHQPRLPTQRAVGELLGQHNFAQVYASRAALMAEARRTCARDPGRITRVAFEAPSLPALPPPERHIADDRRSR